MMALIMSMALLGAAVLQSVLPSYAFMGQVRPPLLLAVVLYYALHYDVLPAMWAALLAGFLHDALGGVPMGYTVVAFGLLGLMAGRCREFISRDNLVPHSLIGAAASFVVTLAMFIVLRMRGDIACHLSWALLKAFWAAILGMWCVPLVCVILAWADGAVGNSQKAQSGAEI